MWIECGLAVPMLWYFQKDAVYGTAPEVPAAPAASPSNSVKKTAVHVPAWGAATSISE